ncbi:chromosomal replication initiator protein DnaA [Membranihabitans marinus]|uniref:chromosomal replication initiator protein DnaA n=1 Tax=Membranihabitans marinus TaxID=1227546 RepID=UPI001F005797|nr:chromosomal replication initiator protein DnaA [Membranihabitans marinus]
MVNDGRNIWDKCLQIIKTEINPQAYKTWFEPIEPVRFDKKILTIQVPNNFFYEWIEEHYVHLMKKALLEVIGNSAGLNYRILKTKQDDSNAVKIDKQQLDTEKTNIKNPFVFPGIKKLKIDPNLNAQYHFDNYVEGDCNRLARNAGMAISKKPGGTAFNPLVIYGDVGLGKTHLAHAIGNQALKENDQKQILYVSSEKFTNQIVHAIKNGEIDDLLNFYHQLDILIVDDIQFFANKTKTMDIFFHIFNQLHQDGKQLVLTSDRPPKDLEGMEERLISRFKWGLTADLQSPDYETRMAILDNKMLTEGLELPDNVLEFICYNVKNNIRELEGVLVSLIAQSSLNNREIDLEITKEVVQKFVEQVSKEITIQSIQELVASHFKIEADHLQSKSRKRNIVIARQLSMYFAKKHTNKSLKTIGDTFGGRDHSTVIYSCKTVKDLMDTDKIFKETVDDLEKKITMSLHSK